MVVRTKEIQLNEYVMTSFRGTNGFKVGEPKIGYLTWLRLESACGDVHTLETYRRCFAGLATTLYPVFSLQMPKPYPVWLQCYIIHSRLRITKHMAGSGGPCHHFQLIPASTIKQTQAVNIFHHFHSSPHKLYTYNRTFNEPR